MLAHYRHFLRGCAIDLCECQLAKRTKEIQLQTVHNEVHTGIIQVESKARKEKEKSSVHLRCAVLYNTYRTDD